LIKRFNKAKVIPKASNIGEDRLNHLRAVCNLDLIEGDVLEFGVYQGSTINLMADYFPDQTLYGFDSFEGLPEKWVMNTSGKKGIHEKGHFTLQELPEVKSNVKLVKGFFDKSLPVWLEENNLEKIKILHVDCDLYSSTKVVFDLLNDYIVQGTVIVFDEFYPWGKKRYDNWAEHEYKALQEWTHQYNRDFSVEYRNNHMQCSIRIL